jgi:hypothetical protein
MMLLCGHVICKEPLSRLAKGNPNAKFKVCCARFCIC